MAESSNEQQIARDVGNAIPSVALKIRLAIGAIFVAGIIAIFLPSHAGMNHSHQQYVKLPCHVDSGHPDACK